MTPRSAPLSAAAREVIDTSQWFSIATTGPEGPHLAQRVLIDRLWPRGVRKANHPFDEWWKDLAPSTELRKWFGHDPARWNEFRRRYAAELAERPEVFERLRDALRIGPVTILTATQDGHCNHAVALMEIVTAGS